MAVRKKNRLIAFLFGRDPDVVFEEGQVRHVLPDHIWRDWEAHYQTPDFDWHKHIGEDRGDAHYLSIHNVHQADEQSSSSDELRPKPDPRESLAPPPLI